MRILGLVNEWLNYIGRRHSQHTVISYERTLQRLLDYTPQHYEDLTAEHIERFLQAQLLGTNSQNTYLTAIKSFCKYCKEFHDLPNPASKVKYLKPKPSKQRIVSTKELQQILVACNEGETALILFLSNTGLRTNELKTLTMESVSPDGHLLYVAGKGGKQRAVSLNKTAKANLSNTINFSKNHKKLYNACRRLAQRAGVKPFGPHALRHYFATELSKSVPLCLLSKLLGHSSTAVTEKVYVHLGDADLVGLTDILDRDPP